MFCPNCGEELPDGSKFCSSCGEKISDATSTNTQKSGLVPFKKIIAIVVVVMVAMVVVFGLKTLFSSSKGKNAYVYLSNGKQRCTRGYKRYKETSGLIEWKECQIFHSIFT